MSLNNLKKMRLGLLLFLVFIIGFASAGGELSTVKIAEASTNGLEHCLHYKVKGLCFWLVCGFGCKIKSTLRVDHYLPDAVVTVTDRVGNNPWDYANSVVDPLAKQTGQGQITATAGIPMGFGHQGSRSLHDIDNRYKEVDVIGNPGLLFFSALQDFLLPSSATPFAPYYLSLLDAYAWRYLGLEKFYPGTLIPGLHEVGQVLMNDWGPVYPRNGFVVQPNDAKAAAVLAFRASHIATQFGQPHLYMPLSETCGHHCNVLAVQENNADSQFQMIYPEVSSQCVVFGTNDTMSLTPWASNASQKGKGRYVWLLWRHYQGCIPSKGAYLGQI